MKEHKYKIIFSGFGILLVIILFYAFLHNKGENKEYVDKEKTVVYEAGVYNKELTLDNGVINLQVVLGEEHVKSIEIANLDDKISALYPFMERSVESISKQLATGIELEEVVLSDDGQFTEKMILNEVDNVLNEHRMVYER